MAEGVATAELDDMEYYDSGAEIFPLGHYTYRDMEEKSPYFQVEREPDEYVDHFFDRQINDDTRINTISKDDVVAVLWLDGHSRWYFQTLRTMSVEAGDHRFYHSAIKAAATLVYLLFTKEYLYETGRSATLKTQLDKLWQEFAALGRQGCSVHKVSSIVCGKLMKKTYSLVTELEVTDMFTEYQRTLPCPKYFDHPYIKDFTCEEETEETRKKKNAVLDDLQKVVRNMEPPRRFKVDVFTRVLIKLAKMDAKKYGQMLLTIIAVYVVDTDALDALSRLSHLEDQLSLKEVDDHLKILISGLFTTVEQRIERHLVRIHRPLDDLMISDDVRISSFVYDIIEVAELRRCALGSRFINRNHLIWAFYECGYGLPRKIRNMSKLNIVDEDHPPYHIYLTSHMLTKWLEVEEMRVEHFIFAVLYPKDIIVDESQMTEFVQDFAEFMKEVDSDSKMRPKVNRASSEKLPFESYDLDYDISLIELNEAFKSGRLDDLVHDCFSMMVA